VFLAKGATTLCVETLPFEVGLADSTVEAFGVPVLPESLDPSVGRFDGEFAAVTFGGEQFVPVFRAILIPVLDVEARRADRLLAVEADETFWMPGLAHGIDAVVFDGSGAFGTKHSGCQVWLMALTQSFLMEAAHLAHFGAK